MAYFLKQSKNKKGIYLQIYESFYDPARGHTAHKSYKAIGYLKELKKKGINDPIVYYKNEVDELNREIKFKKENEKIKKIGETTPEKYLGKFLIDALNKTLGINKDMSLMNLVYEGKTDIYKTICSLINARIICPSSKRKTYLDVLPLLGYKTSEYSLDQLYDVLNFIGEEYEKFIEIYNHCINNYFKRDTSKTYYDGTNFYFEIDKEDDFRKKGPSKENRRCPIVGMGLLLDSDTIPIGMKLYPGNESEKPYINDAIETLRKKYKATGKIIRVADKGLNCADNIANAILAGDGYIFSKSIKQLPKKELTWALQNDDWKIVKDKDGNEVYRYKSCVDEFEYKVTTKQGGKKTTSLKEKRVVSYNHKLARKQITEINRQVDKARSLRLSEAKKSEYGDCAKYVVFSPIDKNGEVADDVVAPTLNYDAIKKAKALAGYNMIVTSEIKMSSEEIYTTYHNLWRIEESFKIMKSQLDARPVFLQKESTITGHFLICYLSVLLLRLLQIKIFDNEYCCEDIIKFIRQFRVVDMPNKKFINLSIQSNISKMLEQKFYLPVNYYYLSKKNITDINKFKFRLTKLKI